MVPGDPRLAARSFSLQGGADQFPQHLSRRQAALVGRVLQGRGLPARQEQGQFNDFIVDGSDFTRPRLGGEKSGGDRTFGDHFDSPERPFTGPSDPASVAGRVLIYRGGVLTAFFVSNSRSSPSSRSETRSACSGRSLKAKYTQPMIVRQTASPSIE